MRIKDKMLFKKDDLIEHGPINIVILGDSISHGAFNDYIDYDKVYWNLLRKKMNAFRDYTPINMICAAIGGKHIFVRKTHRPPTRNSFLYQNFFLIRTMLLQP